MGIKLQNKKQIKAYLNEFSRRVEAALIFQLEVLVTELVNHAKESAEYIDQTANLKSSIGGVVLKNGRSITYKGFEGSTEGTQEGNDFIKSLIGSIGSGYAILVVAGMEYAAYVEDVHNLNVLKKTELKMGVELPKAIDRLILKINK